MSAPIATLRDDFEDASIAAAWTNILAGSGTVNEVGTTARCALPSSVAGSHSAFFRTVSTYDLTTGSVYVNIAAMVSTAVAASFFFDAFTTTGNNILRWTQTSNTLKAQTVVAGVTTDQFSATWNATNHKYLRIRNSGTDILFESSTNGTSWTTRATVALSGLFAITDLKVQFGASCGNVASPGTLQIAEVNLILPALTTNWRWTQVVWPLSNRYKVVTLAIDTAGTAQGYVVTADGIDVAGDPSGNVRYFSGPADGGRLLTEQATQAAAQAMAVDIPLDGRFDLPTMVEARCIRVYHRSIDGNAYTLREVYPRRLVQADDIEAESIRALHIAAASITGDRIVAGTITADLITVAELEALSINTGDLSVTGVIGIAAAGGIYQGSGSFASPTTGLKLYNSGGVGKLSGYNATVEQITFDTDGKLKAGVGKVILDANGLSYLTSTVYGDPYTLKFYNSTGSTLQATVEAYNDGTSNEIYLRGLNIASRDTNAYTLAQSPAGKIASAYIIAQQGITTAYVRARLDASGVASIFCSADTTINGSLSTNGVTSSLQMNSITLANNATAQIAPSAAPNAMIFVMDSSGRHAQYTLRGGVHTTQEIADPSALYTPTAGSAASTNIYWSAGNTRYEIENKTGGSLTYSVFIFQQ